jgi:hypothetical protein
VKLTLLLSLVFLASAATLGFSLVQLVRLGRRQQAGTRRRRRFDSLYG